MHRPATRASEDSQAKLPEETQETHLLAPTLQTRWWRQSSHLAAVAALIAAAVPLTAAVNGFFELKQQERLQLHEIRLKYLDRAIDPTQNAEYRERVLSFLLATLDSTDPMRSWAAGESNVLAEVVRLRRNIAEKERELKEQQQALQDQTRRGVDQQERLIARVNGLERELVEARSQLSQKERQAQITSVDFLLPSRPCLAPDQFADADTCDSRYHNVRVEYPPRQRSSSFTRPSERIERVNMVTRRICAQARRDQRHRFRTRWDTRDGKLYICSIRKRRWSQTRGRTVSVRGSVKFTSRSCAQLVACTGRLRRQ